MGTDEKNTISGIELLGDRYEVVQSLIRNRYKAYDEHGDLVLQGKQKLFKLKEEFPFKDADGNVVFTVKAGSILDVAGDYTLVDAGTDEPIAMLDRNWTLLTDKWKVRDPTTEAKVAEIKSKSLLKPLLRRIPYLGIIFQLLPHTYDITSTDGSIIGSIDGQFSLKDRYLIELKESIDAPRETIVAAAMVIDAIEGN